jgi:transformation/transcription domain-associated protein
LCVSLKKVPFRLTPNLVNFLTPIGITGVFSSALLAAAQTIADPEFTFQDYLGAVLRDELISWQANHSAAPSKPALDNESLCAKLERNVTAVQKRLRSVVSTENNQAVDVLVKHATASNNLCHMPPTWHPWL